MIKSNVNAISSRNYFVKFILEMNPALKKNSRYKFNLIVLKVLIFCNGVGQQKNPEWPLRELLSLFCLVEKQVVLKYFTEHKRFVAISQACM